MRRLVAVAFVSVALASGVFCQTSSDQVPPTQPVPAQTAPTQPAPTPAAPAVQEAAPAASPQPTGGVTFDGWFEVGYRWVSGIGGSADTYRSIVNLGSGPKLLGTEFTLTDPKHRLFDKIRARAYSWGDEPGETLHVDASKSKWYQLNADYRDIAYFNDLPSYADPLASRGITLDEQSFDMRRHMGNYTLDLLPGNWIVPYFGFERDSGTGTGVSTFVSDVNTFPVLSSMYDLTNLYRGGVRIERKRFHVTLEQGGTTFVNNQNESQSNPANAPNYGNNLVPYLGQTLDLQNVLASYGIRGSSVYSKGLLTANVASWLDLYGQVLYSQPQTRVNYQQYDTGNLVLQNQLLFYTGQQYLLMSAAKLPQTSASFGGEIRPMKRVRIIENWLTDRMHNAGSANSTNQLTSLVSPSLVEGTLISALLASTLANNYSQEEVNVIYDPISKLTLRGGYRYVWGEAIDSVFPAEGLASSDEAKLRRNVGLAGFTYRPLPKLSLSASAEVAASGGVYFRTSLYDYQKVQAKARYQVTRSLNLSGDFSLLDNHDPQSGVNFKYIQHSESLSLLWTPSKQGWDFEGSYTRSTIRSDLPYLEPEIDASRLEIYRDNAHIASTMFHVKLKRGAGAAPQLTAGGSLFISSGSRPTAYYQPMAKLTVPWGKRASLFAQWTYYGYGEAFYLFEGFRTHMVIGGLRVALGKG